MHTAKRARVELTVAQKQEICRYYEKNPAKTIKELTAYFSTHFNLRIGNSTIGNIVKRAEHWNAIEFPDNVRRTPSTKFSNMEKKLFEWICDSPDAVTESQIEEKASELIKEANNLTKEWDAQRGWLTSFKRRFNLVLVSLENQKAEGLKRKGYRPGKMPVKRDPIHRVHAPKGRKPSRVALIKPPANFKYGTSSIIYDAAIENILQGTTDATDDDSDTEVIQANNGTPVSSVEVLPVSISVLTSSSEAAVTSVAKSSLAGKRDSSLGLSPRSAKSNANSIHEAAIENILKNPTVNSNPESSTAADAFPADIRTTANRATSVTLSCAQKAMGTLRSFFEENQAASHEDLGHLQAIETKLKWLSAKDALGTLRTFMVTDPSRYENDLQYFNDLEQRL